MNFFKNVSLRLLLPIVGLLLCSLPATAQDFGGASFGDEQQKALKEIKVLFGEPSSVVANTVVYKNKTFKGLRWSEIHFGFKEGRFDEARFFMMAKDKRDARRETVVISNVMKKDHTMSEDIEEDGAPFFAGGQSPFGFGHLFTIFVSPYKGKMTSQLRYGPFELK